MEDVFKSQLVRKGTTEPGLESGAPHRRQSMRLSERKTIAKEKEIDDDANGE